jgi:cytochrome c-type biogenesis protein CcmE
MAEMTWEKSPDARKQKLRVKNTGERLKFLIGGVLILGAIAFLMVSGTLSGARYFIMVDDVAGNPEYVGQTVRLSGAVLGDTIEYDPESGDLSFTIVNIPSEFDDLAQVLHESVNDPTATRLDIVMTDQTMPDLLQHEAQAILTGEMTDDGYFYGTELNLKCPSRLEEGGPGIQAVQQRGS